MATLASTIAVFTAAREYDRSTLSRLGFWADEFGDRELTNITSDEVDAAILRLAERGRLQPRRNGKTQPAGAPLSGATLNRYLSRLASVYRYARRLRLLPRAHLPPTRGIEKSPEPIDPDRYLRPEEVERLLTVAQVLDRKWQKLPALILVAFHTGLRIGNLLDLRWQDVNLDARTITVLKTKNGRPMVSALSERAAKALSRLPGKRPADERVFGNGRGQRFHFRRLWGQVCDEAGLPGRNFHQLRHGCGSVLANAGVGQATIMAVMGHRTLTASARYMHSDVSDKRRVVDQVFT